ncbi:uncharacterized protein LOC125672346 isoform X2 [Ostrea edulis]|uniref:uncharacterized protein LOC125672346 isoform X2 n=2 Tax=Ostrea edulis TaxID=37623 RepID=UPI002095B57D|nr:uncharacterized protein LOC125672346 isoform X2 [Ostrea edulis]
MMQARVVGNCSNPKQQQPVGHFETPENHAYLRAANCSDHPFETVTHKVYPMDTDTLRIRWFPPENTTAEIYFVATIVSQRDKFWTGIFSHTVRHKDKQLTPGHPQCSMRRKYVITTKPSSQSSRGHILHSNNLFICNLLVVLLCAMYED